MVFQLTQEQLKKDNLFLAIKKKKMMEINLLKCIKKRSRMYCFFFKYKKKIKKIIKVKNPDFIFKSIC